MLKPIASFLLVSILFACNSGVVKLNKDMTAAQKKTQGLYYALPKALVKVDVQVLKETKRKGKYNKYAEMLGHQPLTFDGNSKINYRLHQFRIDTVLTHDEGHIYKILDAKGNAFTEVASTLEYSSVGHLNSINVEKNNQVDDVAISFLNTTATILGGTMDMLAASSAPSMSLGPAPAAKAVDRREEEANRRYYRLAELKEVRDQLINTPSDRSSKKLLEYKLGQIDREIEGIFAEFVGTTSRQTNTYTFYIDPKKNQKISLLRIHGGQNGGVSEVNQEFISDLSNQHAFASSTQGGQEVTVEIKDVSVFSKHIEVLEGANPQEGKATGLVYRIPGKAEILLRNGAQVQKKLCVDMPQFGLARALPKKMKKVNLAFTPSGYIQKIELSNKALDTSKLNNTQGTSQKFMQAVRPETEQERLTEELELLKLKQSIKQYE